MKDQDLKKSEVKNEKCNNQVVQAKRNDKYSLALSDGLKKWRTIELVLYNDYRMFKNFFNSSEAAVRKFNNEILDHINFAYNQINMEVVLKHVEIWTEGDKIAKASNFDDLLAKFNEFASKTVYPVMRYDVAHLITADGEIGGPGGLAYVGTVCSPWSTGITQLNQTKTNDGRRPPNQFMGQTVAHEIGHNLGLYHTHDRPQGCKCPSGLHKNACVMMYGGQGHEDTWTDCALDDLTKYAREDKFHCLEVEGADGVDVSTQTTKVPKLIAMA